MVATKQNGQSFNGKECDIMAYLCKQCLNPVEINQDNITAYCANCEKELTKKETISSWTFKARMDQLKAMHDLMLSANDEGIYMTWIVTGVPDEPSEDDFEYIATSDELYNECFDLFVKLIKHEGNRWQRR